MQNIGYLCSFGGHVEKTIKIAACAHSISNSLFLHVNISVTENSGMWHYFIWFARDGCSSVAEDLGLGLWFR